MLADTRKQLFGQLYTELLKSDVLNLQNYNSGEDMEKEINGIVEEVFRDYMIIRGEELK